jgi:hypothetical protein
MQSQPSTQSCNAPNDVSNAYNCFVRACRTPNAVMHSHAFDRWLTAETVLVWLRDSQACQTRDMLLLSSKKRIRRHILCF